MKKNLGYKMDNNLLLALVLIVGTIFVLFVAGVFTPAATTVPSVVPPPKIASAVILPNTPVETQLLINTGVVLVSRAELSISLENLKKDTIIQFTAPGSLDFVFFAAGKIIISTQNTTTGVITLKADWSATETLKITNIDIASKNISKFGFS